MSESSPMLRLLAAAALLGAALPCSARAGQIFSCQVDASAQNDGLAMIEISGKRFDTRNPAPVRVVVMEYGYLERVLFGKMVGDLRPRADPPSWEGLMTSAADPARQSFLRLSLAQYDQQFRNGESVPVRFFAAVLTPQSGGSAAAGSPLNFNCSLPHAPLPYTTGAAPPDTNPPPLPGQAYFPPCYLNVGGAGCHHPGEQLIIRRDGRPYFYSAAYPEGRYLPWALESFGDDNGGFDPNYHALSDLFCRDDAGGYHLLVQYQVWDPCGGNFQTPP